MFFPHLMNIKLTDLVLEIGPGTCPYWRSDVLADKFQDSGSVDRSQFGGGPQVTDGKPIFFLDGPYLPFKDQQFDYLICSQVLEHVPAEDISILVKEFSRVAKRIYIEIPRPAFDIVYDFSVHLNFIDIVDNHIIYIPKSETNIGQTRSMTTYCRSLRESTGFAIENISLAAIAVGQEFTGPISLMKIDNEKLFFQLSASSRFRNSKPNWIYRTFNFSKNTFSRLVISVRRKYFISSGIE